MEAVTLSVKQQNKSLASKKSKKNKGKINSTRPVLATSKPDTDFPGYELTSEECIEFQTRLLEIFCHTVLPVPKWSVLKNCNKEERQKLRQYKRDVPPSRAYVVLGFNEVTRAVENKTAIVVIIADNIVPAVLTKHIYNCCFLFEIALFKVHNFKEISKKCFGYSSMAMAIKKMPKVLPIYEFYNFMDCRFGAYMEQFRYKFTHDNKAQETKDDTTETVELSTKETKETELIPLHSCRNAHLSRKDKETREFIPVPKDRVRPNLKESTSMSGFTVAAPKEVYPFKIRENLKPTVVKKVQKNEERVLKKRKNKCK